MPKTKVPADLKKARRDIKSEDPVERGYAVRALSHIGEASDIQLLLPLLTDASEADLRVEMDEEISVIRYLAIEGLLTLADLNPGIVNFDLLTGDSDPNYRQYVAMALSLEKTRSELKTETSDLVRLRLGSRLAALGQIEEAKAVLTSVKDIDGPIGWMAQSCLQILSKRTS